MIHNIPCSTFEKLKAQTDVQAFCPLIGWKTIYKDFKSCFEKKQFL